MNENYQHPRANSGANIVELSDTFQNRGSGAGQINGQALGSVTHLAIAMLPPCPYFKVGP
jgi:hypothetical protein